MSIGSIIKRLRREKDITQEQLAEYLGITSRAISQWECDRTAPDISQIPALCHIFHVSSDVLLGIDVEKNSEEIKKYLDTAQNLLKYSNLSYLDISVSLGFSSQSSFIYAFRRITGTTPKKYRELYYVSEQ